ncbi:hypothetical protein [Pseudomonas syringae]|uniref:hypothetical protein n=1 Tax=Pseudomonas syringae TaxID=317 RepID=UPI001F3A4D82|nr:hypothetical protein [Pseudomonas syringae]MCF5222772.1 hypothetical protein [Pseudomonas syringae]MCF5244713.1 hypothetical protein [Pseudomonas syringae]
MMHENKIPFGERDGTLFRAFEVENGLRCNCICPGCRQPLNAANNGEKVVPHFRHAQSNDCTTGFREGVRRSAVALIVQHKQLMLPAFLDVVRITTASGRMLDETVELPPVMVTADSVERFVELDELRGHAVLHLSGRQLIVRIKMSSRMEHERYRQLQALEHSSMEIDLHRLTLEQINDADSFKHAVLQDPSNRSWIRCFRGESLKTLKEQQLQSRASELNAAWLKEQAEREAEERARQLAIANETAEHDLALKTHRATQAEMATHHPTQPQDATVNGRSELIAATMLKALHDWNGKAAECKACHLLSAPGSRFCPYCAVDGRGLIETTVSPDLPATIHKRMYCSAKPSMSVKAAPLLVVRPDI